MGRKELRDVYFTKSDVEANTSRIEVITENGFREKNEWEVIGYCYDITSCITDKYL